MFSFRSFPLMAVAAVLLAGAHLGSADASAHTLVTDMVTEDRPPPALCSPELSSRLAQRCMIVRSYAEEVLRFWWVRDLDSRPAPQRESRLAYPEIHPAALLGVVEVMTTWFDYLDQPIDHGVYTLRYLPAPPDPLHHSLLRWRDTLVLVPVLDDEIPGRAWEAPRLQAAATDSSRSRHPRSMAIFPTPMRQGPRRQDPPRLVANEFDQVMLAFWLETIPMSVVVSGSALPSTHE